MRRKHLLTIGTTLCYPGSHYPFIYQSTGYPTWRRKGGPLNWPLVQRFVIQDLIIYQGTGYPTLLKKWKYIFQ